MLKRVEQADELALSITYVRNKNWHAMAPWIINTVREKAEFVSVLFSVLFCRLETRHSESIFKVEAFAHKILVERFFEIERYLVQDLFVAVAANNMVHSSVNKTLTKMSSITSCQRYQIQNQIIWETTLCRVVKDKLRRS